MAGLVVDLMRILMIMMMMVMMARLPVLIGVVRLYLPLILGMALATLTRGVPRRRLPSDLVLTDMAIVVWILMGVRILMSMRLSVRAVMFLGLQTIIEVLDTMNVVLPTFLRCRSFLTSSRPLLTAVIEIIMPIFMLKRSVPLKRFVPIFMM